MSAPNPIQPRPVCVSDHSEPPSLSVVVPVRNEATNVAPLIAELRTALRGLAFELVYVDDGSDDLTHAALVAAVLEGRVRVVRHRTSCGQSAAIVSGIRAARGAWIATIDGDGQNDPADLPAMLERARVEEANGHGPVLIAGHRTIRRDSNIKRVASRVANAVRARLLGDATPDTGCGLKVFRRTAFLELPHFDHMHRFLPALFIRAGGRVVSLSVNHRPRLHGRSKYGTFDRLLVGFVDLFGVWWLARRWSRPDIVP